MSKYIKQEDAVFAACKILDKFGGCKMGAFCPDVGCSEVRDIINTFNMIEIPNHHGRLIDADATIADIRGEILEHQMNGMKGTPFYIEDLRTMWQRLEDEEICPTIIPAEEGET